MYRLTVAQHLEGFTPKLGPEALEVAEWAVAQGKRGSWLSTKLWQGDLLTAAYVVEHLQLGVFIPADPWAPVLSE
jgi:hypothetical protein